MVTLKLGSISILAFVSVFQFASIIDALTCCATIAGAFGSETVVGEASANFDQSNARQGKSHPDCTYSGKFTDVCKVRGLGGSEKCQPLSYSQDIMCD